MFLFHRNFLNEAVFHTESISAHQIYIQGQFRILQVINPVDMFRLKFKCEGFQVKQISLTCCQSAKLADLHKAEFFIFVSLCVCVCFPEKMMTSMMWPPWLESTWERRMHGYWPPWSAPWYSPARISPSSHRTQCSAESFTQVQEHSQPTRSTSHLTFCLYKGN